MQQRAAPPLMARLAAIAATVAVLTGMLAGCAPAGTRSDPGTVLGSIVEHLEAASSAVATATLVVEFHEQGRLPDVTTDAAIDDATLTVSGAVHGITTDRPFAGDTTVVVTAILSGPVLGARIVGGRPDSSRWHVIPWRHVTDISTAVHLGVHGEELSATWVERWLRERVFRRIPGGRFDPEVDE